MELRAELARLEAVPVSAEDSEDCMVPCLQSVRGHIEQIRDADFRSNLQVIDWSMYPLIFATTHYTPAPL